MLELQRLWSFDAHQTVHAFAGGRRELFVACRSSRLHCLDALTGESRWETRVRGSWGWLAVDPSRVYYLDQHSRLDAFDRRTGAACWSRELHGINGWLHASGSTVVVGGWRGYSDIVAMDGADGTTRWILPARQETLHSTRIHAESSSLLIAVGGERGVFLFVDLETGTLKARIAVPGAWATAFSERPIGTSGHEPLVLDADDVSFSVVTGAAPSVVRVELPEATVSRNLRAVDGVVPYMTCSGELVAWSLTGACLLRLGAVEHGRRDLLPFAVLEGDLFAYGTSFGMLGVTSTAVGRRGARRVSKRVSTELVQADGVLAFGTAGGEVLAFGRST